MEKQELKSARELVLSPYLTPSQAMQILGEVARYEGTDEPLYTDLPNLIVSGFDWIRSPQGHHYWNSLYSHVKRCSTEK